MTKKHFHKTTNIMVVTYSKVRYFKGAAHRIKKLHLENPCKTSPTTGGSVKSVPIAIGIRVLFQFIKHPPPSPIFHQHPITYSAGLRQQVAWPSYQPPCSGNQTPHQSCLTTNKPHARGNHTFPVISGNAWYQKTPLRHQ